MDFEDGGGYDHDSGGGGGSPKRARAPPAGPLAYRPMNLEMYRRDVWPLIAAALPLERPALPTGSSEAQALAQ